MDYAQLLGLDIASTVIYPILKNFQLDISYSGKDLNFLYMLLNTSSAFSS